MFWNLQGKHNWLVNKYKAILNPESLLRYAINPMTL